MAERVITTMLDAQTEVDRLCESNRRLRQFVIAAGVGFVMLGSLAVVQFVATLIACQESRAAPRDAVAPKREAARALSEFKNTEEEIWSSAHRAAVAQTTYRMNVLEVTLTDRDLSPEDRAKVTAEYAQLRQHLDALRTQGQARGWCGTAVMDKPEMEKADEP